MFRNGCLGVFEIWLDGVVQTCHETIILSVLNRIVFVGVALRAGRSQTEPRGRGRMHAIHHGIKTIFERISAAFLVEHGIAMEASGDNLRRLAREINFGRRRGRLFHRVCTGIKRVGYDQINTRAAE